MITLAAFADEAGQSLSEQIDALKRNNIKLIELRSIDGKNVLDFSFEEALKYQEEFKKNGLQVFSIGSPIGKVDIDCDFNLYKEKVIKACRLAKIFETKKIRIFSFFKAYEKKELVFLYLNEMVKIAKEFEVELYHENEKDIFGDTLIRVKEIMDNVHGLRFVYDPANYLQVNQDSNQTIKELMYKTDYFHIKDVIASTGELVPAGYGDGQISKIISLIKDDKTLTVEPHLAIFAGYNQIDNTELKNKFMFKNNQEAFDAAVRALKEILINNGYKEVEDGFMKE